MEARKFETRDDKKRVVEIIFIEKSQKWVQHIEIERQGPKSCYFGAITCWGEVGLIR